MYAFIGVLTVSSFLYRGHEKKEVFVEDCYHAKDLQETQGEMSLKKCDPREKL